MLLILCFVAAHFIGKHAGWWGPLLTPEGPLGSSAPLARPARPPMPQRVAGSAGRSAGSVAGRAEGRAARPVTADAPAPRITPDVVDPPPLSRWGRAREHAAQHPTARAAFTAGWAEGKVAGRERFEVGRARAADRLHARRQWEATRDDALASGQFTGFGPGWRGRMAEHIERGRTCPRCGHGNFLSEARPDCACPHCGCAAVPADPATPDPAAGPPPPPESPGPPGPPSPVPDPTVTDAPTPGAEHQETPMTTPTATVPAPTPAVSGEVINIAGAQTTLTEIATKMHAVAEQMATVRAEKQAIVAACDGLMDGLSALEMDAQSLADIASVREQAQAALADAQKAEAECVESAQLATTTVTNIQDRHGALMEAHASTAHAAKREAYRAA